MSRRGFRARWRAEVIRSTSISDSVRVVLIVLADHMTDAGYVSVPRAKLAELVGRAPRRITERLEKARDAGYLDIVRAGRPGRTAEYQAMLPAGAHVRTNHMVRSAAPIMVRTSAPTQTALHGAHGGPTNTRVSNASRQRNDNERDLRTSAQLKERSDDELTRDPLVAAVFPQGGVESPVGASSDPPVDQNLSPFAIFHATTPPTIKECP